jgi:hypothetical protein
MLTVQAVSSSSVEIRPQSAKNTLESAVCPTTLWRDEFSSGSHDEVTLRLRRFSPLSPRLDGK